MQLKILFTKLIFVFLSVLLSNALNGQIKSEQQLIGQLKSFSSDAKLNAFLKTTGMLPSDKDTSRLFHSGKFKTDVFRKNLFGDSKDEIVIQLRESHTHTVNVYYYDSVGMFKKVPGNIVRVLDGIGYDEQSFTFSFEEIFKSGSFAILERSAWSYNLRSVNEQFQIWAVTAHSLSEIYSFEVNSSSYNGQMTYQGIQKGSFKFVLPNNTYPKVLYLDTQTENIIQRAGDEPRELNRETGRSQTTVYFTLRNDGWKVKEYEVKSEIKKTFADE